MSVRAEMRSPKALVGAFIVLAGLPAAIAASNLGIDAQAVLHVALGAGFLLFAWAAFDFRTPHWISLACCAAIGVLAAIFLLQAASHPAPALQHIAYDILGQRFEKILGFMFLLWCMAVLVMDSRGWRRAFGAVALAVVLCVEGYGAFLSFTGAGPAPDALKLAYLPLFVWLALEGQRQR